MKFYKDICAEIFSQHDKAEDYKCAIGRKGLYEQTKQNRRFYSGDQWYGAKTGSDKPLVRHNVIKRIGDYKTAVIGGEDIAVSFSPNGVQSVNTKEASDSLRNEIIRGKVKRFDKLSDAEIMLASRAVSEYFNFCAKRLHLDDICNQALKNAYVSGTGVVYAYWDCDVKTGLFADKNRKIPIMGDVCAEVIDIENVDFSDPAENNVQNQEYIIISSRRTVADLIREAKRNGVASSQIENIKPDNEYCSDEAFYSEKATVLTKFFKDYDKNGEYTVKAIRVCKNAVIKPEWDIGLKMYPIAKFNWEDENKAYGASEITNLIPNQIAINRMLTATVWSVMMMGMPIMLVNNEVITEPITNNPGQIISFCGEAEDFEHAIRYVSPPQISGNIDEITNKLIENTLSAAGATDAALGTIKAQNTSAINAVKESARLPLTLIKKRYLSFIEEIAAIFLQFMISMYGERPIAQKTEDDDIWFFPFDGKRYENIVFSSLVSLKSETESMLSAFAQELDNLGKEDKAQVIEVISGQTKEETE